MFTRQSCINKIFLPRRLILNIFFSFQYNDEKHPVNLFVVYIRLTFIWLLLVFVWYRIIFSSSAFDIQPTVEILFKSTAHTCTRLLFVSDISYWKLNSYILFYFCFSTSCLFGSPWFWLHCHWGQMWIWNTKILGYKVANKRDQLNRSLRWLRNIKMKIIL